MVYGIGTDILNINHIKCAVADVTDPFVKKVYTSREVDLIESRPTPLYSYATRFAGKEAVFKALGIDGNHARLNEIEILENDTGQPVVHLLGDLKRIAVEKSITQLLLSLSYDTDYAIAYAMALTS